MATVERRPSEPRVELEPVTCWPLLLGSTGFVLLTGFLVAAFALWSALRPATPPSTAILSAPSEQPRPSLPAEAPPQPAAPRDTSRVVVVHREVINPYVPLPPAGSAVLVRPGVSKPVPTRPIRANTPLSVRAHRDEADLRASLWKQSRELDLEAHKGTSKKLIEDGKKVLEVRAEHASRPNTTPPERTAALRALLDARDDLRGLPLLDDSICQSDRVAAGTLAEVSRQVRRLQSSRDRLRVRRDRTAKLSGSTADVSHAADEPLASLLNTTRERSRARSTLVRPFEQMFQSETPYLRKKLVQTLEGISGKEATAALARRAIFDLAANVRLDAIEALRKRPLEEARGVFLAALRHPWPAAADHAAHALVELNDQAALADLEELAELPAPSQPVRYDATWKVRELVRVNHLRNCLLCHAPSRGRDDPVRGPIPESGKPLPEVYYDSRRDTPSVRADIVYFRQDFSVVHKVDRAAPWPSEQRFDYLVRLREVDTEEVKRLRAEAAATDAACRHRQAILEAIHALKGRRDLEQAMRIGQVRGQGD